MLYSVLFANQSICYHQCSLQEVEPTLALSHHSPSSSRYPINFQFIQSVYSVILSRDLGQPIQTLRLRCTYCDPTNVKIWINAAVQRGVEHLDLGLPLSWMGHPSIKWLPSFPNLYFNCVLKPAKTLVVLKLMRLALKPFSPIDFPLLKVLHLECVRFVECRCFAELLSGCPVLEDLVAKNLCLGNSLTEGEFKKLSKLVRADIYQLPILLEAVSNVEFLRIDQMDNVVGDSIPVFHNLTHIELYYTKDWLEVIELLKRCPKLQVLVLEQSEFMQERKEERGDWPYPQSVPESISLHLKACHLNNYKGGEGEFRFARYIMQNARHLRSMAFRIRTRNEQAKNKMIDKLFFCTRLSGACKFSFKW